MMRVLVTGGAGFIGSHCVDALVERGDHVTVVDNFSTGSQANLEAAQSLAAARGLPFDIHDASVADPAFWAKLPAHDAIVHLASQGTLPFAAGTAARDTDDNVACALPLLNWVRRTKVKSVVYANTAGALYGDAISFPTDERSLVQPLSPYGASKAFFELYLSALCRSLKMSTEWSSDPKSAGYFSWISLRLGNVYGPRQVAKGASNVVPLFFKSIAEGKGPTVYGDGTKTRDYVYVADAVKAVMAALDRLKQTSFDEALNVATGVETKDLQVFRAVLEATQALARDPAFAKKLAPALGVSEPAFAKARPGEAARSVLNVGKVDAFLAWLPETKFETGIAATIKAFAEALP